MVNFSFYLPAFLNNHMFDLQWLGQIDGLYRRVVILSIAEGGLSGQYVENSGFKACSFC